MDELLKALGLLSQQTQPEYIEWAKTNYGSVPVPPKNARQTVSEPFDDYSLVAKYNLPADNYSPEPLPNLEYSDPLRMKAQVFPKTDPYAEPDYKVLNRYLGSHGFGGRVPEFTKPDEKINLQRLKNLMRASKILERKSTYAKGVTPDLHNRWNKEILRWTDYYNNKYKKHIADKDTQKITYYDKRYDNNPYEPRYVPIPPELVKAITIKESRGGDHFAYNNTNNADAKGIMQLLPDTRANLSSLYGLPFGSNVSDYDPNLNIRGGVQWLAHKLYYERPDLVFKDKDFTNEQILRRLLKLYNGWSDEGQKYSDEVWGIYEQLKNTK